MEQGCDINCSLKNSNGTFPEDFASLCGDIYLFNGTGLKFQLSKSR